MAESYSQAVMLWLSHEKRYCGNSMYLARQTIYQYRKIDVIKNSYLKVGLDSGLSISQGFDMFFCITDT
jgi:hypothetical protein